MNISKRLKELEMKRNQLSNSLIGESNPCELVRIRTEMEEVYAEEDKITETLKSH